jgi:hypothetical protein
LPAVNLQPPHQLVRSAQCGQMSCVDDVGCDPQSLAREPSRELEGEPAVVTACEHPGRDARPRVERPGRRTNVAVVGAASSGPLGTIRPMFPPVAISVKFVAPRRSRSSKSASQPRSIASPTRYSFGPIPID